MPSPYVPPDNDHLTSHFADIVPDELKGSDKFLDIVTWNIRWFHDRDAQRVDRISAILDALAADIFVFQEIKEGSLETVIKKLQDYRSGNYEVAYGTTGGDQRVAIMYDLDWVRTKSNIEELYGKGKVRTKEGKDAFPRLPLLAHFSCLSPGQNSFEFQLLGIHLKSQLGDGSPQRRLAASKLASWLTKDAPLTDSDVIILGDWNAPTGAKEWRSIRALEKAKRASFQGINDKDEISYLMYRNRNNLGQRLDLNVVSVSAMAEMAKRPKVVRWKSLDELIQKHDKVSEIRAYIKDLKEKVSDHMPVVTRFHFTEK